MENSPFKLRFYFLSKNSSAIKSFRQAYCEGIIKGLGLLGMDQDKNNIVMFRKRVTDAQNNEAYSDLYTTGAHMIQSLKEEIENRGQMTQGLSFSFDMLLYGLRKPQ